MLFSVEQAFVERDEIQATQKTSAWEATFSMERFQAIVKMLKQE